MWIILAVALLALQFNKKIAFILLYAATAWGVIDRVLDWRAVIVVAIVSLACYLHSRFNNNVRISVLIEAVLVVGALALALHVLPGFHNLKVLDALKAGPESAPFSMYFNFDKALIPFLLIICIKTLFTDGIVHRVPAWKWAVLVLSVPVLLFTAVMLGGLAPERHFPVWLPQFVLANIFFVSLAEEALFRGYIQQRLAEWVHPVIALAFASVLFGAMHYAGGILLVVFATFAGLIYGIAWMLSKRLWVAVLFHFGLNLCHLLFFTYPVLQMRG